MWSTSLEAEHPLFYTHVARDGPNDGFSQQIISFSMILGPTPWKKNHGGGWNLRLLSHRFHKFLRMYLNVRNHMEVSSVFFVGTYDPMGTHRYHSPSHGNSRKLTRWPPYHLKEPPTVRALWPPKNPPKSFHFFLLGLAIGIPTIGFLESPIYIYILGSIIPEPIIN